MNRRFFVISALGTAAGASQAALPALARELYASGRVAGVTTVRAAAFDTHAGGCSNRRRRSPHGTFTLNDVLAPRSRRV